MLLQRKKPPVRKGGVTTDGDGMLRTMHVCLAKSKMRGIAGCGVLDGLGWLGRVVLFEVSRLGLLPDYLTTLRCPFGSILVLVDYAL